MAQHFCRVALRLAGGLAAFIFLAGAALAAGAGPNDAASPVIPQLPAHPTSSISTVPANGDLNPYGVAFVPQGFPDGGPLRPGDILVSNFNNGMNLQGTGSTIVRISRSGEQSLFFQGASQLGLSTALAVLRAGFVLVGSVPSLDGSGVCTPGPQGQEGGVGAGGLLIIDRHGHLLRTLAGPLLDGPWDLTVRDQGARAVVFVSNALSGAVTRLVLRLRREANNREPDADDVQVESQTQIASGYMHRCDPSAFVVAPTGVALDGDHDVLFVASTGDNEIFAVTRPLTRANDAGTGFVFVHDDAHLHGPLGLVRALNGDLLAAQGDAVNPDPAQPSEIVEFSPAGRFVAQFSVDSAPGAAFGLDIARQEDGFRLAAVDDALNALDVWDVF